MDQNSRFCSSSRSEEAINQPSATQGVNIIPSPNLGAWICPLCNLRSLQFDASAFLRHLDQLHKEEVDSRSNASATEALVWRDDLIQRAFAVRSQDDFVRPSFPLPPTKTNSFGNDFQRLSIGSQIRSVAEEPPPALASGPPALSQSAALEEASRIAVGSRQSTSSLGSRLPHGHFQSPVNRIQSQRTSVPPADADFRKYTLQSREASREILDSADEATDHVRRKRQSGTSPPSSSPSVNSPRQQIPLPRNRGVLQGHPDPRYPNLILEPDSRGISQEQLATEVKTIYNALATLETKCIKVDKEQAIASQKGPISPNVWRVLIGIHRHLLNDHHDFFLASQHPSASAPLHKLAVKYNMPARMWKHGIHGFLELLRHQLPHSLEFMISFIYLAYQMMSLLLETVPSFEETWIECLGDLSRYRMAVEEDDPKDRETWSNVARYWYSKAADRMPNTGRLYHHLAILARPNALQQNFLYTRSLISAQPFLSARESVQTLYDPVIRDGAAYIPEVDAMFIKTSAFIFYRRYNEVQAPLDRFLSLLDNQIGRVTSKWREYGTYVAGVTIGALFDSGNKSKMLRVFEHGNYLAKELDLSKDSTKLTALRSPFQKDVESERSFAFAETFFFSTLAVVLKRPADRNTHAYVHVIFCFFLSLVSFYRSQNTVPELQEQLRSFLNRVPWEAVCRLLNTVSKTEQFGERHEVFDFLRPEQGDPGPLPEDFLLRGMIFTQTYFPSDWFHGAHLDDDRTLEYQSTVHRRGERLMWIGYKLSQYGTLIYDSSSKTWKPNPDSPCVQQQDNKAINTKHDEADVCMGDTTSDFVTIDHPQDEDQQMIDVNLQQQPTLSRAGQPELIQNASPMGEKIQKDSTTLIIDANVLLNHNEVFSYLVTHRWTVAVPASALTKLRHLSNAPQSSDAANAAVAQVAKELNQNNPDVQVIDEEGQQMISFQTVLSESLPDATNDNDGWELVELSRRATESKRSDNNSPHASATVTAASKANAASIALVSDDEAVMSLAEKAGIYVIASQLIRVALMDGNTQAQSNFATGSASGSRSQLATEGGT